MCMCGEIPRSFINRLTAGPNGSSLNLRRRSSEVGSPAFWADTVRSLPREAPGRHRVHRRAPEGSAQPTRRGGRLDSLGPPRGRCSMAGERSHNGDTTTLPVRLQAQDARPSPQEAPGRAEASPSDATLSPVEDEPAAVQLLELREALLAH